MALEITGMTRSFTFKKGSGMITLDDPEPVGQPRNGHELLLQLLPGADHGDGARTGHQE